MTVLTLETTLFRNPDLIATEMHGEIVMMSIEHGEYFGMNNVGSRIWELLGSEKNLGDICKQICNEYEIDEEQCQSDMLEFIGEMLTRKIILS